MKYFKFSQMLHFTEAKLLIICIDLDVVVLLHILQLELLWNMLSVQEMAFITSISLQMCCFTGIS